LSHPADPRRERIARSLEKQRALTALGAELLEVDEGRVVRGLTRGTTTSSGTASPTLT